MGVSVADITEIATGLGMLAPDLEQAFGHRPSRLRNVPDSTWVDLVDAYATGERRVLFEQAFANGRFFLQSGEGLRDRAPSVVEWTGRHRVPGDDAIPADLRVDHVYLISCKHLSRIVLNSGPSRIFDRGLLGDGRSGLDWFLEVAPRQYQAFYESAVSSLGLDGFPAEVIGISRSERLSLREGLRPRLLPEACREPWRMLCRAVAEGSTTRWRTSLTHSRQQLEMFWRMLRVSGASYFVLGTSPRSSLRLRVGAKWDWQQEFELAGLSIEPRVAGQPEVAWTAVVRRRSRGESLEVSGHVEIRWSHGRFNGFPEAKVYLDTPHVEVPGYYPLLGTSESLTLL